MVGAKLVMPGPKMDAASICELMHQEDVTISAAVPTVWIDVIARLREEGVGKLRRVLIGGAAGLLVRALALALRLLLPLLQLLRAAARLRVERGPLKLGRVAVHLRSARRHDRLAPVDEARLGRHAGAHGPAAGRLPARDGARLSGAGIPQDHRMIETARDNVLPIRQGQHGAARQGRAGPLGRLERTRYSGVERR